MRRCGRRVGRVPAEGIGGKIRELRRIARAEYGASAACLLAALGNESQETDAEHVRAMVGAVMMAELIHDVRQIKRLLSKPEGK